MDSKTPLTVSLSPEVVKTIREMKKDYGFVISEWIEERFRESFMSVEQKRAQIDGLKEKIIVLKKEINSLEQKQQEWTRSFNRAEKRWVQDKSDWEKKGLDLNAIHRHFNVVFERKISFREFKKLMSEVGGGKKAE